MTGAIAQKMPANDTAIQPLTMRDLQEYMQSGCKAPAQWRIGTEHEKFLYHKDTHAPATYDGHDGRNIKNLLEILADRYAWTLVREGEMVVGVTKGKYSIVLETGGQIELSGAPLADMHMTARELHNYLDEVRSVCNELNLGMMGIGLRPKVLEDNIPLITRPRYATMFANAATADKKRWALMTAAVQTNIDYGSESDMIKKFRVGLALQPIVTAMFANSPFLAGQATPLLCQRQAYVHKASHEIQQKLLHVAFDAGFDFQNYLRFIVQQPITMLLSGNEYEAPRGGSFEDLMAGKLSGHDGRHATLNDFLLHLSTIHSDVRLRNYIEMRGADAGQWRMLIALPALWTGLLYDSSALDEAYQLIKHWSVQDMMHLRANVARTGLNTRFRLVQNVRRTALDVLKIAYRGMRNRAIKNDYGEDETIYLDRLIYFVASGRTPAEHLLSSYHNRWGQNIDRVIDECSF